MTRPRAGLPGPPSVAKAGRIRTTRVPACKKLFALSLLTSLPSRHRSKSSSLTGILLTGTLSPVSILSFTIASPDSKNTSAGTVVRWDSMRLITSPGTSALDSHSSPVKRYEFRWQNEEGHARLTSSVSEYFNVTHKSRHFAHACDSLVIDVH